jgi:hypothetical protein
MSDPIASAPAWVLVLAIFSGPVHDETQYRRYDSRADCLTARIEEVYYLRSFGREARPAFCYKDPTWDNEVDIMIYYPSGEVLPYKPRRHVRLNFPAKD